MSGNWNRTPRKGEKSINAVRSDQEHRVRVEYRDAGRVEGLVMAWSVVCEYGEQCEREVGANPAGDIAFELSMRIMESVLEASPKGGRIALSSAGAPIETVDAAENRLAKRRRLLAQAKAAAKALGSDDA